MHIHGPIRYCCITHHAMTGICSWTFYVTTLKNMYYWSFCCSLLTTHMFASLYCKVILSSYMLDVPEGDHIWIHARHYLHSFLASEIDMEWSKSKSSSAMGWEKLGLPCQGLHFMCKNKGGKTHMAPQLAAYALSCLSYLLWHMQWLSKPSQLTKQ